MVEEAGRPTEPLELRIWVTPEGPFIEWWNTRGILKLVRGASTLALALALRDAQEKSLDTTPELLENLIEGYCSRAAMDEPPKWLKEKPDCRADVVLFLFEGGITPGIHKLLGKTEQEQATHILLSLAYGACWRQRVVTDRGEFADWVVSLALTMEVNVEDAPYADPFGG